MKGLILKDLYVTFAKQKMLLVLPCVLLALALVDNNNVFLLNYSTMFVAILPISLLTLDENDKWTAYCGTLPVSKGQYVSGKFVINLIATVAIIAICAIAEAVWLALNGGFDQIMYKATMVGAIATAFLAPAVQFPFVFRFGADKGRILFLSVYLILSLSSVYFLNKTALLSWLSGINIPILIAAVAAVYALSWLLSIRMYEKRTA